MQDEIWCFEVARVNQFLQVGVTKSWVKMVSFVASQLSIREYAHDHGRIQDE